MAHKMCGHRFSQGLGWGFGGHGLSYTGLGRAYCALDRSIVVLPLGQKGVGALAERRAGAGTRGFSDQRHLAGAGEAAP